MVCNDVETKPIFQELTGESLPSGANRAPDARLHIHARGFLGIKGKGQRSLMYGYVTPALILKPGPQADMHAARGVNGGERR